MGKRTNLDLFSWVRDDIETRFTMLGEWNVAVVDENAELAKYFDRVARVRFESDSVKIIADVACDLWHPSAPRARLTLWSGHREFAGESYCARGIVGRKDEGHVMISCGGLLWLVKCNDLAERLEIEDLVTWTLVDMK